MTPSRRGRMATMLAGVRPTIRFASAPMASTRLVRVSMATTLGSLITIPRCRTVPSVLAVPRPMPTSWEGRPRRADPAPRAVPAAHARRLGRGEHHDPHAVLGVHPTPTGAVVHAFHPEAKSVELIRTDGGVSPMSSVGDGVWATLLPGIEAPLAYRLRFTFAAGATWQRDDPYRLGPTV